MKRASWAATAAFGVAVAACVAGAAVTAGVYHSKLASATAATKLPVAQGRYIGAATSNITGFDNKTGIRANLVPRYLAWGTHLPTNYIVNANAKGAATLIELLPYSTTLSKIVAGGSDAYLKALATEINDVHVNVMVSFAPEANASTYKQWGYKRKGVTPKLYIQAFRHVHDVITKAGAKNVTWVWQVTHNYPGTATPVTKLWPGKSYVNLIGLDGYYYKKTDNFANIFGTGLAQIRKVTNKPVIISEVGVGPYHRGGDYGAGQPQKFPNLFESLTKYHVAGLVYFDHRQNQWPIHQDWSLHSGSAGLRVFDRYAKAFAKG